MNIGLALSITLLLLMVSPIFLFILFPIEFICSVIQKKIIEKRDKK